MADQRQAADVLLARARDDLDAARLLLETSATDAIVGFLAQPIDRSVSLKLAATAVEAAATIVAA